jgi:phosphoribosylaminoimidazolecarboxamide formyltransferase/IMP cyclohydrolase
MPTRSFHKRPSSGQVQTALLSVHDKTGLVEFARELHLLGIQLIASGGTAESLRAAQLPVTSVEEHTGTAALLQGRVKTLHPRIHAGLLADRRDPNHLGELAAQGHTFLDLVVCNLYPFEATLRQGGTAEELLEAIDIGGPAMIRAAAKNAAGGVTVVTDPADYPGVLRELQKTGQVPWEIRLPLAAQAFQKTARFDQSIAHWYQEQADQIRNQETKHPENREIPKVLPELKFVRPLRYGENPHQSAALYRETHQQFGVAHGEQLQGKDLSYINYLDLDAAYRVVFGFQGNACAVVKHGNPCGLATASNQVEAFLAALSGDPLSAFGSVLGFNRTLEPNTAQALKTSKLFVECLIAPDFSPGAREALKKRKNLRLVVAPPGNPSPSSEVHRIGGGLLWQSTDPEVATPDTWKIVTEIIPEGDWQSEVEFALKAVRALKSNAITLTKNRTLLGAGMGLTSRVDACKLAIEKAGDRAPGSLLASDAFFPFDDCVRLAAKAGVQTVVQPGGSKRDQEVLDTCNELGLVMIFTQRRHFRH